MEKSNLIQILNEGVTTVTFTKKDGTERVMRCTRNSNLIPTEFHPKGNTPDSGDIIRAFDLDVNGWRSFDFTTLKV